MAPRPLAHVMAVGILLGTISCGEEPPRPPPEPPPSPGGAGGQGGGDTGTTEALPDLVIVSVSRTPSDPVPPGTTVQFSVTVQNRGNGGYPARIVVAGPGNYSGSFDGLSAGQSKVARIGYPVHSPNATYGGLRFTVDPDNVIRESNETNNSSREFSIRTGP